MWLQVQVLVELAEEREEDIPALIYEGRSKVSFLCSSRFASRNSTLAHEVSCLLLLIHVACLLAYWPA